MAEAPTMDVPTFGFGLPMEELAKKHSPEALGAMMLDTYRTLFPDEPVSATWEEMAAGYRSVILPSQEPAEPPSASEEIAIRVRSRFIALRLEVEADSALTEARLQEMKAEALQLRARLASLPEGDLAQALEEVGPNPEMLEEAIATARGRLAAPAGVR